MFQNEKVSTLKFGQKFLLLPSQILRNIFELQTFLRRSSKLYISVLL